MGEKVMKLSPRHRWKTAAAASDDLRFLPCSPWVWIWACLRWRLGGRSCRRPPRCCWRWRLSLVRRCPRNQSKPEENPHYSVSCGECNVGRFSTQQMNTWHDFAISCQHVDLLPLTLLEISTAKTRDLAEHTSNNPIIVYKVKWGHICVVWRSDEEKMLDFFFFSWFALNLILKGFYILCVFVVPGLSSCRAAVINHFVVTLLLFLHHFDNELIKSQQS